MRIAERYRGSLLGLAVGDALGAGIESKPPGTFEPVEDMTGGGPFNVSPGQWTDDTSLALCLAESLIKKRGFDPIDQMERYLSWYRNGHLSSRQEGFGIGRTTFTNLMRFEKDHTYIAPPAGPTQETNGSLMRVAPVPLAFAKKPFEAIERSGDSSRTTHSSIKAIDACRYMGALLTGALNGESKEKLLSQRYTPVKGYWEEHPLCTQIDEVASGSFKEKEPPEIRGTGYVADCLEAALWAFHKGDSFREGCLLAVNLGDDADTTAAVYGQLAGAYYGESHIPERWASELARKELITLYAEELMKLSGMI